MSDILTAKQYQELMKNKTIIEKHYGKTSVQIIQLETEQRYTADFCIQFAIWCSNDNSIGHRKLKDFETLNKSKLQ